MKMKRADYHRAYVRLKNGRLVKLTDVESWFQVAETGSVVSSNDTLTAGGLVAVNKDGTAVITLGRRGTIAPIPSLDRAEAQAHLLDKDGIFLRVSQDATLADAG